MLENERRHVAGVMETVDGYPTSKLYDQESTARIFAAVTKHGPAVQLVGDTGEPQLELSVFPDPALTLQDSDGRYLLIVDIKKDKAGVTAFDPKGTHRAQLAFDQVLKSAGVVLFNADGLPRKDTEGGGSEGGKKP